MLSVERVDAREVREGTVCEVHEGVTVMVRIHGCAKGGAYNRAAAAAAWP
jgi:hypothetical protein